METEPLFNEEEEPPGNLTGLLDFKRHKRQTYDLLDRKSTRLNSSHDV